MNITTRSIIMKNYFNYINSKLRLIYVGLALTIVPVTSTFAMLPMMSEVFEQSSIITSSANQQQGESDKSYSGAESNNQIANSYMSILKNYDTQLSRPNTEQELIVSLSENTIIMRSTS